MRNWITLVENMSLDYEVSRDGNSYMISAVSPSLPWYHRDLGQLRLSYDHDAWRVMNIFVHEHGRGQGVARDMLRKAVSDLGPVQTSRVFSDKGKRLFNALVDDGLADQLVDDYVIHF